MEVKGTKRRPLCPNNSKVQNTCGNNSSRCLDKGVESKLAHQPRPSWGGHMWAGWLHYPCRLGGRVPNTQNGEYLRSGCLTLAVSGSHMWAKWVNNHSVLGPSPEAEKRLWLLFNFLVAMLPSDGAQPPGLAATTYQVSIALHTPSPTRCTTTADHGQPKPPPTHAASPAVHVSTVPTLHVVYDGLFLFWTVAHADSTPRQAAWAFNISLGRAVSCQHGAFSGVGAFVVSFVPATCPVGGGMWGIFGKPLKGATQNTQVCMLCERHV